MRPARLAALFVLAAAAPALAAVENTGTSRPANADAGPPPPEATPPTPENVDGGAVPTVPAQPAVAPPAPRPEEPFTPLSAPPGEAPPLPFPVVLSVGPVLNPRVSVGDFYFDPHVRIRLRGAFNQQDPNLSFIGRTNGFNMAMARLGISGGFRRTVKFALSLEGAADVRSQQNQLTGDLSTRLRDAYLTFAPWDFLQITAGHFRPPSDRETLSSTDAAIGTGRAGTPQLLPEMSVGTRGVYAGEGLQVRGMDPGRDLGVMVHGDVYPLPFVGGTYALALVNGNGQNQVLNDNNQPTVHARLTFGVRNLPVLTLADVGLSAHYGRNTNLSALPNSFDDEVMGSALDGVVQVFGFQVQSQVHWIQTRHLTTHAPSELAIGTFVQVAYRDIFGFSPVARVAYYQATSALPQYTLTEFTGGMRYDMPGLPLTMHLAFTHPEETGWGVYDLGVGDKTTNSKVPTAARVPSALRKPLGVSNWMVDQREGMSLTNDRVEAVMQMSF